jgi:hypothetical protein
MSATNRLALLACPAVLIALVIAYLSRPAGVPQPPPTTPGLEDWDVPRLARNLQEHGLEVRLVPTDGHGGTPRSGYLTTTDKGWGDLNPVAKVCEAIDLWQGTVYCERLCGGERETQIEVWGDCCVRLGPFLLFGDRDLMREIQRLCVCASAQAI